LGGSRKKSHTFHRLHQGGCIDEIQPTVAIGSASPEPHRLLPLSASDGMHSFATKKHRLGPSSPWRGTGTLERPRSCTHGSDKTATNTGNWEKSDMSDFCPSTR